jgi:hypothetical protein
VSHYGIDGAWDGEPRQEWIRDSDGVTEHAVFDVLPTGVVHVSVQVMNEIMMALGFRRIDTVGGDVVASLDE